MKPKIFIGSSVESLDIANNIQELLEYDSNPTVWTQGIFDLSSTALDSLTKALNNFDYAIFVFKPEDLTKIRKVEYNTIRDNVIFELGLFIGKLGKEKVFFVTPSNAENLHLPSDLVGINPGTYNAKREDGNTLAALGPFCNQVKRILKTFTYSNINDLQEENNIIKQIAIEKKDYWEFYLSAEILKSRLVNINSDYIELENNLIFIKTKSLDTKEYIHFIMDQLTDFTNLTKLFSNAFLKLIDSFGEPGQAGEISKIKSAVDRIVSICELFFQWEIEVQSVKPTEDFEKVPIYLKGWTKTIVHKLNNYPTLIYEKANDVYIDNNNNILDLNINIGELPNQKELYQLLDGLNQKYKNDV